MPADLPWRRLEQLTALVASWRGLVGRDLYRLQAGPGWLGVALAGKDRPHLFLVARPGAVVAWGAPAPLPAPLLAALGRTRRPPAADHLAGTRLTGCDILPADRVIALRFERREDVGGGPGRGRPGSNPRDEEAVAGDGYRAGQFVLLFQLFGPQGNLVLLDHQDRLLWAHHRPPHRLLTELPSVKIFAEDPAVLVGPDPASTAAAFRTRAPAHLARRLAADRVNRLRGALGRLERTTARLCDNLARDLAAADRGEDHRRDAETLAIHLTQVHRGADRIELPDPRDGSRRVISLNPTLSAAANLDHYFHLARKAERGRQIVADRLAAAEQKLVTLHEHATEFEGLIASAPDGAGTPEVADPALDHLAALLAWEERHASDLGLEPRIQDRPAKRRRAQEPGPGFRRFLIEGKWEAWVGRNNAENDRLTHKASSPNDLWFHAQGVPGSHVILRTGGRPDQTPRRIVAKAAALAALHSRARNSDLVPVICTLRKYVRKPRKSPPGTAAVTREKTLMSQPILAEGVQRLPAG